MQNKRPKRFKKAIFGGIAALLSVFSSLNVGATKVNSTHKDNNQYNSVERNANKNTNKISKTQLNKRTMMRSALVVGSLMSAYVLSKLQPNGQQTNSSPKLNENSISNSYGSSQDTKFSPGINPNNFTNASITVPKKPEITLSDYNLSPRECVQQYVGISGSQTRISDYLRSKAKNENRDSPYFEHLVAGINKEFENSKLKNESRVYRDINYNAFAILLNESRIIDSVPNDLGECKELIKTNMEKINNEKPTVCDAGIMSTTFNENFIFNNRFGSIYGGHVKLNIKSLLVIML